MNGREKLFNLLVQFVYIYFQNLVSEHIEKPALMSRFLSALIKKGVARVLDDFPNPFLINIH